MSKNDVCYLKYVPNGRIADVDGHAIEIRIEIDRAVALRKQFRYQIFADEELKGLSVIWYPERGTMCIGMTETPLMVTDLVAHGDLELRTSLIYTS